MAEIRTYATHFCGFGGACLGLELAGLECVFAIDSDHDGPAVETRRKNIGHQAERADITTFEFKPEHAADLLWTSPPCQTLSTAARDQSNKNPNDLRNFLFMESIRYIRQFKPRFVVVENVTGMLSHTDAASQNTALTICGEIKKLGYHVEINVLNAVNFGLPQERERVFIVGALNKESGLIPDVPAMTRSPRFGDIKEPGSIEECWGSATYKTALGKVDRLQKKHGSFKIEVVTDDDVLPTVTCGWGGGATRKKVGIFDSYDTCFGQIDYLRHPTILEGIRAQGFPDKWKNNLPTSKTESWNLVGNAVPAPVSRAIAEHLKKISLGKHPPSMQNFHAKKAPKQFISGDLCVAEPTDWE